MSYQAADLADKIRSGELDDVSLSAILSHNKTASDVILSAERAGLDADSPLLSILGPAVKSHKLREAVEDGDETAMSAAVGLSETRTEATGYSRLIDACKPAAHQILIKGPKGSGKTAKALEISRRLYQDGHVEKILTNIGRDRPSDPAPADHEAVEFAEDISRYLEFAKEPGEKIAIFDEFSTSGNAYTGQSEVQQVMSRVINAFRKSDGGSLRTLFIGHENDNDIHPLVKKQSDVVIQADGKVDEGLIDCATVFRGWSDYVAGDDWFRVRGLRDIPEWSDWNYSTNYFAHLEWNLDNPDRQIDRGQLLDDWDRYQDDEEEEDTNEQIILACRGTKTDESDCNATVNHESGYCHAHRAQWDGETDPRIEEADNA